MAHHQAAEKIDRLPLPQHKHASTSLRCLMTITFRYYYREERAIFAHVSDHDLTVDVVLSRSATLLLGAFAT